MQAWNQWGNQAAAAAAAAGYAQPFPATPAGAATPAVPAAAAFPAMGYQYFGAAAMPPTAPDMASYNTQQWGVVQQQQWQQWQQWQQQFQQWQQQYGDKYQESLGTIANATAANITASTAASTTTTTTPTEVVTSQPPPLPPPDKPAPPPPPEEIQQQAANLSAEDYRNVAAAVAGKPIVDTGTVPVMTPAQPPPPPVPQVSDPTSGYSSYTMAPPTASPYVPPQVNPFSVPPPTVPTQPPPMVGAPPPPAPVQAPPLVPPLGPPPSLVNKPPGLCPPNLGYSTAPQPYGMPNSANSQYSAAPGQYGSGNAQFQQYGGPNSQSFASNTSTMPYGTGDSTYVQGNKRPYEQDAYRQGDQYQNQEKKSRNENFGGTSYQYDNDQRRNSGRPSGGRWGPPTDENQQRSNSSKEVQIQGRQKVDNPDELSEAEKAFDIQFKQWEEQFNKWKEQNINHPDKTQYREYEAKWESWREQLLQRREQMRKKRETANKTSGAPSQGTSPNNRNRQPGRNSFDNSFQNFNQGKNEPSAYGSGNYRSDQSGYGTGTQYGQDFTNNQNGANDQISYSQSNQMAYNNNASDYKNENSKLDPGFVQTQSIFSQESSSAQSSSSPQKPATDQQQTDNIGDSAIQKSQNDEKSKNTGGSIASEITDHKDDGRKDDINMDFLKSSSSGIPGLDLLPESDSKQDDLEKSVKDVNSTDDKDKNDSSVTTSENAKNDASSDPVVSADVNKIGTAVLSDNTNQSSNQQNIDNLTSTGNIQTNTSIPPPPPPTNLLNPPPSNISGDNRGLPSLLGNPPGFSSNNEGSQFGPGPSNFKPGPTPLLGGPTFGQGGFANSLGQGFGGGPRGPGNFGNNFAVPGNHPPFANQNASRANFNSGFGPNNSNFSNQAPNSQQGFNKANNFGPNTQGTSNQNLGTNNIPSLLGLPNPFGNQGQPCNPNLNPQAFVAGGTTQNPLSGLNPRAFGGPFLNQAANFQNQNYGPGNMSGPRPWKEEKPWNQRPGLNDGPGGDSSRDSFGGPGKDNQDRFPPIGRDFNRGPEFPDGPGGFGNVDNFGRGRGGDRGRGRGRGFGFQDRGGWQSRGGGRGGRSDVKDQDFDDYDEEEDIQNMDDPFADENDYPEKEPPNISQTPAASTSDNNWRLEMKDQSWSSGEIGGVSRFNSVHNWNNRERTLDQEFNRFGNSRWDERHVGNVWNNRGRTGPWDEDYNLEPATVVDYGHRPAPDIIKTGGTLEPVHRFDYDHRSGKATAKESATDERWKQSDTSFQRIQDSDERFQRSSEWGSTGRNWEPEFKDRDDRMFRSSDVDDRVPKGEHVERFLDRDRRDRRDSRDRDWRSNREGGRRDSRDRDYRRNSRDRDRNRNKDSDQRDYRERYGRSGREDRSEVADRTEKDRSDQNPRDRVERIDSDVKGKSDQESGKRWGKDRSSKFSENTREDRDRGNSRWENDRFKREASNKRERDCERPTEAGISSPSKIEVPDAPPPPTFTPSDKGITSVLVEDLLCPPGRSNRPARLVIILRGPPGSGKTFVAKLIKDKEVEMGGSAPRILSLDDYFMVEVEKEDKDPETGRKIVKKEMEYEYEAGMDKHYRSSLMKAFRKTINDGYFPFIIVDCVNSEVKHYEEMWSYSKQKGFQVYICEMDMDASMCTKRNIHNRSEKDILDIIKNWEDTPKHHLRVDVRSLLQSIAITEVEMEDSSPPQDAIVTEIESSEISKKSDEGQDPDEEMEDNPFISKWEKMEPSGDKLNRLDGLMKHRKAESPPQTLEDWLQLTDDYENRKSIPGMKRVRWADLEERKEQEKMRAIGFVVGQTDWSRMTDPTFGEGALTQTKYI